MQNRGVKIEAILPGSPAEEAGFKSGDLLVKIDGHEVEDLLDVLFHLQPEGAEMEVLRDGEQFDIGLVTSPGEGSGWKLEPLEACTCHCNCTFCFIDQLPEGLRSPLYLKDEDYRFSFLFGNYLTLVGLNSHDYGRIFKLRLSPLYVSIHATDPEIRGGLLGIGKAPIIPHLKRLIEGGIEVHGQIVIVPGVNDGQVLKGTLEELMALYPGLASLSVVPAGLTRHRQKLPRVRLLTSQEVEEILHMVDSFQQRMMDKSGRRWVYAADELVLKSRRPIPEEEAYEDYPQIENGVGMVRWTWEGAREAVLKLPKGEVKSRNLIWVTGRSASPVLETIATEFSNKLEGLEIDVVSVENSLLGEMVTVAGLLGGREIYDAIVDHLEKIPKKQYRAIYLPPDCLNSEGIFLDGWDTEKIAGKIGIPVYCFSNDWNAMLSGEMER